MAAQAGCSREAEVPTDPVARTVNFYSWSDYIHPDVVARFEKETGIDVNHDTFDSIEMLETKLLTGRTGYDVVVIGSNAMRVIGTGALRPLDRALLPNWRHLDSGLMAKLAGQDPANRYVAGYLWGTTGIAYNVGRVRELLPDAPTDSWRLVFDPKVISKLAPCGFSIVEAPGEVIAAALAYLGRDPGSATPADLQAVDQVLADIRPSVRKFDVDSQISDLANGDICVMVTWPTSVVLGRARIAEAAGDAEIRYVIPREGTITWFDSLGIPDDAPHPVEAHAFIDYLMRPEIAAVNAGYVGNATMNQGAMPQLPEAMRNDPSIYPSPEVIARLTPLLSDNQEQSRAKTRLWTRFKSGQ